MTPAPERVQIGNKLLADLLHHLIHRKFHSAFALLDDLRPSFGSLDREHENTHRFVGRFALLVDAGYQGRLELSRLVEEFDDDYVKSMKLSRGGCIKLARAVQKFMEGDYNWAARELTAILEAGLLEGGDLRIIARYMLARCHKRSGHYEAAMKEATAALHLTEEARRPEIGAIILLMIAWLHFQCNRREEAESCVEEARVVLETTEDYAGLGNLYSLRGRILRRVSMHDQACVCYEKAEHYFRKAPGKERELARVWINRAVDMGLWAMRYRTTLQGPERHPGGTDIVAQMGRKFEEFEALISELANTEPALPDLLRNQDVNRFVRLFQSASAVRQRTIASGRDRSENLRAMNSCLAEAGKYLDSAEEALNLVGDMRQLAKVRLLKGYLLLDDGKHTEAAKMAQGALTICRETDHFSLARVRLLQAAIEFDNFEEFDLNRHLDAALEFAKEAMVHARITSHLRLIGKVALYQAIYTASKGNLIVTARDLQKAALKNLNAGPQDYIQRDLARLNRILSSPVSLKRDLSSVLNRFITEELSLDAAEWEFYKAAIEAIWPQYRSVDALAKKLEASPDKIRRAARELGLK